MSVLWLIDNHGGWLLGFLLFCFLWLFFFWLLLLWLLCLLLLWFGLFLFCLNSGWGSLDFSLCDWFNWLDFLSWLFNFDRLWLFLRSDLDNWLCLSYMCLIWHYHKCLSKVSLELCDELIQLCQWFLEVLLS